MNFGSIARKMRNLPWPGRRDDGARSLGLRGERAAARHLKRGHHRIIARNYRAPVGEIDLITTEGDTIVFVEVKTRTSEEAEDSAEAVRLHQWVQIERAARYFLMERNAGSRPCRFDLVTVVWPPRGSPQIEHFKDVHRPRQP